MITGGLDAYAGTYDAIGRRVGIDVGTADALAVTAAGLRGLGGVRERDPGAGVPAGTARVGRAGEHRRTDRGGGDDDVTVEAAVDRLRPRRGRYDPRAITVAAAVAFALLLVSTAWLVLAAVAAWLALAWATARADREPVPVGLLFAAILALGAFVFTLGGGLGHRPGAAPGVARGSDRPGGHLAAGRRRRRRPA